MEHDFNLLDEPWVCVRKNGLQVTEVSLRDALLRAHTYSGLAGETKTQDFAVLRLMLAVIYTVFSRYDADGEPWEPDTDDLIDNWEEVRNAGRLPEKPFERYFSEWHGRFRLFDEQYPFFQTNTVADKGNPISTSKMIGTLFESNNKARLFAERDAAHRGLTFAEAARWLLHLNSFDDIAAKQPTPKKTWCGKLSLIALTGSNLFETLMLNYCAGHDADKGAAEHPLWEADSMPNEFNRQIAVPDNQAALLTLRSRNLYLCRDGDTVSAYRLAGGDWFEEESVFDEQMTLWRGVQEKKDSPFVFRPKRYDTAKLIWQEFASISVLSGTEDNSAAGFRAAGAVKWMQELLRMKVLDQNDRVRICTAAVIYDYNQATSLPVIDCVSDTLTFHAKLLEDAGRYWREDIIEEIGKAEQAANNVLRLYKELQFAAGRRDKDGKTVQSGETDAKREYYARIDRVFRLWLERLDPDADRTAYKQELEAALLRIAAAYGGELAGQVGGGAVFGRVTGDGTVSAAEALNRFIGKLYKLFALAKTNRTGGEQGEQK